MKTKLLLSLFVFAFVRTTAQTTFQKNVGNPFADGVAGISKTSDDGFVVVGDSYISELQQWDVYAAKFNKNFVLQWTSAVGFPNNLGGNGNGYDDGRAITETSDKGFIITGLTNSFDAVTYMYIVRLKKDGTIKWTKIISQGKTDYGQAVTETSDGGFLLAGITSTKYNLKSRDMYLLKLNSAGDLLWERSVGGILQDEATSLVETTDGYVVAGFTTSFGSGGKDMYVAKVDFAGNLLWSKAIGGAADDACSSVKKTVDNGLILAGSTASFGTGGDFYIVKLDNNGNHVWSKTYGGSYADDAASIIRTKGGGYAVAGNFQLTQFAPNEPCLLKLDDNGNLTWDKIITNVSGNISYYGCTGIMQSADSGYIITTTAALSTPSFNANLGMHKFTKNGDFCGTFASSGSVNDAASIITTPASVFSILNDKLKKQTSNYSSSGVVGTACSSALTDETAHQKNVQPKTNIIAGIRPNPVTDIAFIQFNSDNAKQVSISIAAPSGKIYLQKQYVAVAGENVFKIPVSALPKGIYYIQLHTNKNETWQDKLIKQ